MSISYLSAGLPLGLCNLLIRAGYGLALNLRRGEKQATAAVTCCPCCSAPATTPSPPSSSPSSPSSSSSQCIQHLSSVCVLCSAQWKMLQTHKDGDRMGCWSRTTVIRVDDGNQQVNSPSEHLPSQPIHIPELDLPLQVWEPGPGQAPHPAQLTP